MKKDKIIFDRRRFVRFDQHFVVSYSEVTAGKSKTDITQIKNISLGGMMLTTGKEFPKATVLDIRIRSLTGYEYLNVKVEVVESKQRIKGISYDTRTRFINAKDIDPIRKLIKGRLKKG